MEALDQLVPSCTIVIRYRRGGFLLATGVIVISNKVKIVDCAVGCPGGPELCLTPAVPLDISVRS